MALKCFFIKQNHHNYKQLSINEDANKDEKRFEEAAEKVKTLNTVFYLTPG